MSNLTNRFVTWHSASSREYPCRRCGAPSAGFFDVRGWSTGKTIRCEKCRDEEAPFWALEFLVIGE